MSITPEKLRELAREIAPHPMGNASPATVVSEALMEAADEIERLKRAKALDELGALDGEVMR